MKTPHFSDIDFDTFKKLRSFENKLKRRAGFKQKLLHFFSYLKIHKKNISIGVCIFVIIILFFSFLFLPSYQKNFLQKSQQIYVDLQTIQNNDLKNIFDNNNITSNNDTYVEPTQEQIDEIIKNIDSFQKKIDNKCNELPFAVFPTFNLSQKLQKYCSEIKLSVTHIMEIVYINRMVYETVSFTDKISKAQVAENLFKEIKSEHDTDFQSINKGVTGDTYTNTRLKGIQSETIIYINKVHDLYTTLMNTPADTNGSGNAGIEDKYKLNISNLYSEWSKNIQSTIELVSSGISANVTDSANAFLDEYNKLSTGVSSNPSDKVAPSVLNIKTN